MGCKPVSSERLKHFLVELKRTCNITKAAEKIGFTKKTAYNHKEKNKLFSDDWDNALEEGIDNLEYTAQDHAFNGITKGIYYKGEKIDTEQEYSDGMKQFLLKAHRPGKYRENQGINIAASGGVLVIPSGTGNIEDWIKENSLSTEKVDATV